GEFTAGDCSVFEDGSGFYTSQSGKCAASGRGQFYRLYVILRNGDACRTLSFGNIGHRIRLGTDDRLVPVCLHKEKRGTVGQADLSKRFDTLDGFAVEKFDRAGDDLGR